MEDCELTRLIDCLFPRSAAKIKQDLRFWTLYNNDNKPFSPHFRLFLLFFFFFLHFFLHTLFLAAFFFIRRKCRLLVAAVCHTTNVSIFLLPELTKLPRRHQLLIFRERKKQQLLISTNLSAEKINGFLSGFKGRWGRARELSSVVSLNRQSVQIDPVVIKSLPQVRGSNK